MTLLTLLLAYTRIAHAQADGNGGLNQANTLVRSYYDTATNLMYGIGALVGIIGAIRVYYLYVNSHGDASKAAAGWFGACIFLVIVTTVIKAFFGL